MGFGSLSSICRADTPHRALMLARRSSPGVAATGAERLAPVTCGVSRVGAFPAAPDAEEDTIMKKLATTLMAAGLVIGCGGARSNNQTSMPAASAVYPEADPDCDS